METFLKTSFSLSFASLVGTFITEKNFSSTKFVFTRVTSSSISFPFLFHWTRHGGVGQRSGTGLETPLLGWALPLRILNHVSLDVDVPVFFHPGDVTSFSYFFSWFQYPLSGYLIHNSSTNPLVIETLLFDLGSTQSQIKTVQGFVRPCPFCQDRVAVGPTA